MIFQFGNLLKTSVSSGVHSQKLFFEMFGRVMIRHLEILKPWQITDRIAIRDVQQSCDLVSKIPRPVLQSNAAIFPMPLFCSCRFALQCRCLAAPVLWSDGHLGCTKFGCLNPFTKSSILNRWRGI